MESLLKCCLYRLSDVYKKRRLSNVAIDQICCSVFTFRTFSTVSPISPAAAHPDRNMVSAIVPANGRPAKTSTISGVAGGDAPTLERVDEVLKTNGESCHFLDLVMDRDSAFFRLVYDLKRECLSFCGEVEVGVGFGLVCAHPD